MILKIRSLVIVSLLAMLFSGVVSALDLPQKDIAVDPLLDRIAKGEVGTTEDEGYDRMTSTYENLLPAVEATVMGIPDFFRLSQKPLTEMTINEVIRWQEILRNDLHLSSTAMGRYQIMYGTLKELKNEYGLSGSELFDAKMQDRLAIAKLEDRHYSEWLKGTLPDEDFQYNLAREWASIENPNDPGNSYYGMDGKCCGCTPGVKCQSVFTTSEQLKAEMSQTKSNLAGQQSSESSAVGKWTGYYEGEQTYSDGTESFTGEVTIDYYSDGTYTEKGHDSTHDSTYTETGSWTQNGNTISRQNSDGATCEETINRDNISGTNSGSNEMGSFRSSWSLKKVNT